MVGRGGKETGVVVKGQQGGSHRVGTIQSPACGGNRNLQGYYDCTELIKTHVRTSETGET